MDTKCTNCDHMVVADGDSWFIGYCRKCDCREHGDGRSNIRRVFGESAQ